MNCYPLRWTVTSGPATEPITTAEVKEHLIVQHDLDDTLIAGYATAAREYVETTTGLALIERTIRLKADGSPMKNGYIRLPIGPLQSVTSIKVKDGDGVLQTVDSSYYGVDTDSNPPRIVALDNWPSISADFEVFELIGVFGYGDETTDVPESFRHAIRLLAAHWFEMRAATTEQRLSQIPFGFSDLIGVGPIWSWGR